MRRRCCLMGENPTCSVPACRDERVYGHTTTAMHDNDSDYTPPAPACGVKQDVAKSAELDVETQGDGAGRREADADAASPAATTARQAEDGSAMDVDGDAGGGAGREEGGVEVEGRDQESESTKHVSFLFEALEV